MGVNGIPTGMTAAFLAMRAAARRLGKDGTPEDQAALEVCYERAGHVLLGGVSFKQAPHVLNAARFLADGISGKQAESVKVSGHLTLAALVMESMSPRLAGAVDQAELPAAQQVVVVEPPQVVVATAPTIRRKAKEQADGCVPRSVGD